MNPSDLQVSDEWQDAVRRADALAETVRARGGDLDPAFEALEQEIRRFEASGLPVDVLVPSGGEAGLGFSLRRQQSGRSFWSVYAEALQGQLCDENGELRKLSNQAVAPGVATILATIMTTLALPLAALPVLVPVAVILATTGIDAFCRWSSGPTDEPIGG